MLIEGLLHVAFAIAQHQAALVRVRQWCCHVQAELLQQEIINRHRLSVALERLVDDLPKQAEAAEERMFMAEYVKGYQLVRLFLAPSCCTLVTSHHMLFGRKLW